MRFWPNKRTNCAADFAQELANLLRNEKLVEACFSLDDEPSIRLTLPPLLQEHGFQVSVTANVAEAVEAIKTTEFDVLICDLNIDRKADGFEVMHAMRQANPDAVVVILTAYPAFDTALEGIHIEIDDYIVKPADIASMVRTIERKLSARRATRL
jgi:DNA-binding NtrC family response regulator